MQHGTVFWSEDAERLLGGLDGKKTLIEQLVPEGEKSVFSHPHSPNWQDASTQKQCDAFDKEIGGAQSLADATGSKAHHVGYRMNCVASVFILTLSDQRFSGPQIMRFREKYPDKYEATSRISLVSSFLASLFLGSIAPIDISDVCGANLWDMSSGTWNEKLVSLAAGGPDGLSSLRKKLGSVHPDGGHHLGKISPYFASRYGFSTACTVAPFTGDNPATILSLPLRAGDAMVSLGTSTTFLMSTGEFKPHPSYHFMNHPTTKGLYMFMLCYKNGALARERVRDALNARAPAGKTPKPDSTDPAAIWDHFNLTAMTTPALSQSTASDPMKLGLYFPRPEIVPAVPAGEWHYTYSPSSDKLTRVSASDPSTTTTTSDDDARNIVESQMLSLRLRSAPLVHSINGLPAQPRRVYLVGGGSLNPAIARIAGEVLGGAEGVYRLDIGGNACALGAAYKAVWSVERARGETFEELIGGRWSEEEFVEKVDGGYRKGVWEAYGEAVKGFERMEKEVVREVADGAGADEEEGEMGSALTRERDG